jgi:hypothetical protein
MPIELRFDDLDLREEPESGKSEDIDSTAYCPISYSSCTTLRC